MAEKYVALSKVKRKINYVLSVYGNGLVNHKISEALKKVPAADVTPIVHGKNETEMNPVDEFICSECGFASRDMSSFDIEEDCAYEFNPHYCPNCGAKMDEEESKDNVRK